MMSTRRLMKRKSFTQNLGEAKISTVDLQKDIEFRRNLRADWIVDEAKMAKTNEAIFMHCLARAPKCHCD